MFYRKKRMDLLEQTQANLIKAQENLEKTQENLEKTQENIDITIETKEAKPFEVLLTKAPDLVVKKSPEEKAKAAYALNLCTVSVSQIVEYDDIRTLDQEYNTILNNLNLQNMPKDDALLDILKQLLNVITFFKMQEGDKEMLEKEYQHKMKNKIWDAVPNMSVILTTPNPTVMLFNLATQVGIGYMNYRKAKAETQLEQEKQKWQLKRSAMEQINGLRRELFDTAWRLSKEYDFDDDLRLSEHQIEQYNKILLDSNPTRKYERLLSIKDTFKAYPPFWYYLGNAATEAKEEGIAVECFYEFLRLTGYETKNRKKVQKNSNLLREDQLCASCALELAALVKDDRDEMLSLLETATKVSGKATDVMQMIAMNYLSINDYANAIKILRYLVNEQYNVDLNANLLSSLYFKQISADNPSVEDTYKEYQTLKNRPDTGAFMPVIPNFSPANDYERKNLAEKIASDYYSSRKMELAEQKKALITDFTNKIKNEFFEMCKYEGDMSRDFANFLQTLIVNISDLLNKLKISEEINLKQKIVDTLEKASAKLELESFLTHSNKRTNTQIELIYSNLILENLLNVFDQALINHIDAINPDAIFSVSYSFDNFCLQNNLPVYVAIHTSSTESYEDEFLKAIFSKKNYEEIVEKETLKNACLDVIEKYRDELVLKESDTKLFFIMIGDSDFNSYTYRHKELNDVLWENDEIIAVLNDKNKWVDKDLVLTTKGYFMTSWHYTIANSKKNRVLYSEEIGNSRKDHTFKVGDHTYNNKQANIDKICEMLREIAERVRNLYK